MANVAIPTLDSTINSGLPDNDVTADISNPVLIRDGAVLQELIQLVNTQAASIQGDNPVSFVVDMVSKVDSGFAIRSSDGAQRMTMRSDSVLFISGDNDPPPTRYSIGVRARDPSDTQDGADMWISAGTSQNAAADGGNVRLFAGFGGVASGQVEIGPFNTSKVVLGQTAVVPVECLGDFEVKSPSVATFEATKIVLGTIEIHQVFADPNGSLTAPLGSLACDSVNGTLHQNTDGSTTWVTR